MKKKLIFIIPLMVLFVSLTETLRAQVQPALCKKTAFATYYQEVECPNGIVFGVTATGFAEEEHLDCSIAQANAINAARAEAAYKLGQALSYITCPPAEPEPGGGNIPEPEEPTLIPH